MSLVPNKHVFTWYVVGHATGGYGRLEVGQRSECVQVSRIFIQSDKELSRSQILAMAS